MKKRYLKTPEEIMALKNTDTKIYIESGKDVYFKFINGILCWFDEKNETSWMINTRLCDCDKAYILEEETEQEITVDDIGKLCQFWDDDMIFYRIGRLEGINKIEKNNKVSYLYKIETSNAYQHCRRLTTS